MVLTDLFEKITDFFFGGSDQELIRLDGGKSTCSVCNEPIKGRSIYKVPMSEKHYCKTHAKEEMDKIREETFNKVSDDLKTKVHFSKEEGFHFVCNQCSKHLEINAGSWIECKYCKEPMCKEHGDEHNCEQKKDAMQQKKEAETPRRCEFCGKKIVADTAVKCTACMKYFCQAHKQESHHDCKGK